MNTDEQMQQLHDRKTRGQTLSDDEQAQLELWYARHDQDEMKLFSASQTSESFSALSTQIDTVVAQLLSVTQRIQTLLAENMTLQSEIALLKQQLASPPSSLAS